MPSTDPLDEAAMAGVLAELTRLGRPATFESEVERARAVLAGTDPRQYEAGLVTLGRLAGADPSEGNSGADAAPDATWIFGRVTWVAWEAKSDAQPDSEVDAANVRQAGSHLRYTEAQRREAAPGDSLTFLVTPQERIHHAARAVAEEHVYLARPAQVLDQFDRLVRAWRTLRARASSELNATDPLGISQAEGALPSQWLPTLRTQPLRNRHPGEG